MENRKVGKNGFILLGITLALIALVIILSLGDKTETKEINQLSDLSGASVGVQSGTLYEKGLLEKVPDADVVYYTDPYSMLLALEQGKMDAALVESISFTIESKEHPSLVVLEEGIDTIGIAAAFGETDKKYELYDQFEDFIADCKEDGTLDELYTYWFTNYSDESKVDRSGITGEKGILTVAVETTYEPFEYVSNGIYEGYDIDLVYRFARAYGYEPEIIGLDFDAISPGLSTGKYDMGMNLLPDEERSESMLFSTPYSEFVVQVAYVGAEVEGSNIFDSIVSSFKKTFIVDNRWQQFLEGLKITFIICVLSIALGFVLGTLAYMLCYDGDKLANGIMSLLCEIFGGLPSVVLLMILYYVVLSKIAISNITVSVIAFTLMFTCSTFSIIKTGVDALGIGQYEAARAQGFTSMKTFLLVIYPQVLVNQLPTLQDEISSLIKETSIVGYIAVTDLTKMSDIIRGRTFEPFFPLIVTAIIYYGVIKLLAFVVSRWMRSINIDTRKPEKKIAKAREEAEQ